MLSTLSTLAFLVWRVMIVKRVARVPVAAHRPAAFLSRHLPVQRRNQTGGRFRTRLHERLPASPGDRFTRRRVAAGHRLQSDPV